ncbi:MAG TPA: cysteine--tRNA ligase [Acidimicrobiales bacterium]|nr:cysteine--tRNA ligase [Acidimicrobiales bacterium]
MLRLHDTATGAVRPFEPRDPGRVAMYVCGPTVYDVPHLGHGRFVLVFDVLRRYLEWSGYEVRYVSNITDVDDNIIQRANAEGRSESEVALQYEAVWYEATDGLGVRRPDVDPHATAYVDHMVDLVEQLVERGCAYETGDGVYLSVDSVPGYGLLARQSLDSLQHGARVEVDDEKRSPVDFALWKKVKPGEPSWPSPWGPGRPGWHTECVVMALDLLGDGFDIHGGGQDLAFPHHENERAQALAMGRSFARHWVHNGWVMVGGEKMSKSLGNYTSLVDLLERVDGRAYRLLVLRSHYRSPLEVTPDTTADASSALERLDNLVRRAAEEALPHAAPDAGALDRFRTAMDDDLDTPAALAVLFDAVRQANSALDAGDPVGAAPLFATVQELAGAMGLVLGADDEVADPETAALVAARDEARAGRDWAAADAARDELVARGWVVEDTPTGTRVRRRRN